jgi:hypothetical protein
MADRQVARAVQVKLAAEADAAKKTSSAAAAAGTARRAGMVVVSWPRRDGESVREVDAGGGSAGGRGWWWCPAPQL